MSFLPMILIKAVSSGETNKPPKVYKKNHKNRLHVQAAFVIMLAVSLRASIRINPPNRANQRDDMLTEQWLSRKEDAHEGQIFC